MTNKNVVAAKSAPASVKKVPSKKESMQQATQRDCDRLNAFVIAVLEQWRLAKENGSIGAQSDIIKVSMRQITSVLARQLKNTRSSRLTYLINDTLSGNDIADVYGMWEFVDFDSPDCLFIRLPEGKAQVLRLTATRKGTNDYALVPSDEDLLVGYLPDEDEDEDEDTKVYANGREYPEREGSVTPPEKLAMKSSK